MKRVPSFFGGSVRQLLMRILARIHCALIAAVIFAGIFEMLEGAFSFETMAPTTAYYRSLLFCIPVSLSYYAGQRIPSLLLFIPAAVGISLLSWLLLGHVGGLVAALIVCLFRMHNRILPEEERGTSLFDEPQPMALILFAVLFVISAFARTPAWQRLLLISAVFYVLIVLAFRGIQRIDSYLRLNGTISYLPQKRILRTAGMAVAAFVAVAALLLLPLALSHAGDFRLELPDKAPSAVSQPVNAPEPEPVGGNPLLEALDSQVKPLFHIPAFVSYLAYAVCIAVVALLAVLAVYNIFKNFRRSFTDSRDVVQFLHDEDRDEAEAAKRELRRPSILDRSPNAAVRRLYRKKVLRASKEAPRRWHSPAELEAAAGLEEPVLHEIYEKARYSQSPCTQEDVKLLRSQK